MCYLSEQIEEYFGDGQRFGVNISYSRDGNKLLGTAGALKKANDMLEDEFGVMNGDSFLPISLQEPIGRFRQSKSLAMMLAYRNNNKYDKSNLIVQKRNVLRYDRERLWPGMLYIDYGLSFFKKETLKLIPSNTFYNLDGVYQKLIEQKQLSTFIVRKRFYEIGSFRGLAAFKKYVETHRGRNT